MLVEEFGFHLCQEHYWWNQAKLPSPIEWVNVRRVRVKDAVNTIWWLSKSPNPKVDNRKVLAPYSPSMKRLLRDGYQAKLRPSGHDVSQNFARDNGGAVPSNLLAIANTESNARYLRACPPHTHIIIRGPRANGQDLVLPRQFIKHEFRDLGRVVATSWLGARIRDDERRALANEIRRQGPTRLDRWLESQVDAKGVLRLAEVLSPGGDPEHTQALKARAQELARLGLATRQAKNSRLLKPGWRSQLERMEMHLDIRKNVVRDRVQGRRFYNLKTSGGRASQSGPR